MQAHCVLCEVCTECLFVVQNAFVFTLENGILRLSLNVGNELPIYAA